MQEVEQRMEQLPRATVTLVAGIGWNVTVMSVLGMRMW